MDISATHSHHSHQGRQSHPSPTIFKANMDTIAIKNITDIKSPLYVRVNVGVYA
jgi:hypothetical protein